ncbi:aldehyde dehydrogenase [Rhizobium wenxiniae]|uniref:Acyl-CoA reductase-like NAD-dependent aldehyde dehydrogenase n=1 Tax=Rhizobium wenxiniae TaxID=1737357 RepID=A0A7W9Y802_9HYPH|nr:aldehyde dehydrogenase family protein [Rhizobium wenxiniae]MBB6163655.1 acyl-CoA reductase-like NAD-dependent aldehyde dehydrogenase [Rhizobium wenxiniae]GGG12025.1 aldehyde dehydrogenase [Rhizobium wenxiniae]
MSYRLLVDGELIDGAKDVGVINPATAQEFEIAPRADEAIALRAIAAAKKAFPSWAALTYEHRSGYVEAFAAALEARASDFSRLLTLEQGKPLPQAEAEIRGSVAALRFFASQEIKPRVIRDNEHEYIVEQRYPQGVAAAITPWNFPISLLVYKVGAALMTGNPVIAKPAPTTPLTTLLLGELAARIFPRGVFQTLADTNDLGPLLTSHEDVAHVSFTGSTPTGKKVLESTVSTLKRFTLELGGNDAAIVLDDADIDKVAPAIFRAATLNAGQICFATKRVYAPKKLIEPLTEALVALAKEAKVGDGLEQGTTIGPIQNKMQYDKLQGFIEDSRHNGRIVAGGERTDGNGYFIKPTIVRDLPNDARLVKEEQFGPVLPIQVYDSVDSAIAEANSVEFGLGGIIWTGDVERGVSVASKIETGTIWVNQHMSLPYDVAFGGAKQSGHGLQNGIEGMEDFTQRRIVNARKAA